VLEELDSLGSPLRREEGQHILGPQITRKMLASWIQDLSPALSRSNDTLVIHDGTLAVGSDDRKVPRQVRACL
jgi:hypothetical protein